MNNCQFRSGWLCFQGVQKQIWHHAPYDQTYFNVVKIYIPYAMFGENMKSLLSWGGHTACRLSFWYKNDNQTLERKILKVHLQMPTGKVRKHRFNPKMTIKHRKRHVTPPVEQVSCHFRSETTCRNFSDGRTVVSCLA
jgi:hypothetical protein